MYIGTGKFQLKIRLVIGCFEARYLSISKFETRETLCIYRLLYIFRFYLFVLYLFVCKRVKFNFWPGITQVIMKLVLKAMGSSFLSSDSFTSYRKLWKLMWEVCCRYLLRSETQNQIIPEVVILIALLLIPNEKSTIFEFATFFHVDDQFSWNHPFFFFMVTMLATNMFWRTSPSTFGSQSRGN